MKRTFRDDGVIYTFDPPITGLVKNSEKIIYVLDVFVPFNGLEGRVTICFDPDDGYFFRGNTENININEQEILR